MATTRPHRSSTAASRLPPMNNQIAELRSLADDLTRASETTPPTSDVLHSQSNALRRMRQLLIESNDQTHTKDAFRHVRGFETLLVTLRSLSGFYKPAELPAPDRIDFFEVIKAALDVLSDALNEHAGNRRFFAKRVEHGGWSALEQALGSTGIFGGQSQSKRDDAGQEQLFGTLFAFALGEEAMTRIFRDIDKKLESTQPKHGGVTAVDDESQATEIVVSSPRSMYSDTDIDLHPLRSQVRAVFSGNEILQNPDIIPTIFHFWRGLSGEDVPGTRSKALSVSVLLAILDITSISSYNKAALHVTGVLSTVLPLLFENKCAPVEASLLLELADGLIQYGINKLDDAYYLFRKAASSEPAAEFLLRGMRSSRDPPFIQFDLSLHGFSAIELPDIGRPFPPMSPGGGYTFAAWIRIDRFDTDCHTTLFGAYDDTQTCFLMAYLERDTRCFILQTYMGHSTGIVPSVRFKKAPRFEAGRWYHIAVVHRRAKAIGMGTAKASLFVDGEFTETMKAHYPSHPPVLDSSQESFASMSSSVSKHHILAFLGTPRNLAPRLGRNVISSKLSVASFHLFSEPLSDELIAVYHKLGPRYCGNFQDRLGSFQTYRTSAELHVHNEILHPGREERSDIVAAIRANASHLMPESKILLSFSPSSVMDDDDRNAIDESQLIRSLSRESAKTLHKYTRLHSTPIIINAAVPSVNDALSQPRGFGRLSGDPVVVVPQSLDDAIWRIGGCVAVGLKLVQSAQTLDSVLRSVNILLEAVGGNWRNCEAMEQRNGFAVLAEVLRQKIGFAMGGLVARNLSSLDVTPEECESFVLRLLQIVLRFVGYDEKEPTESLIINPLAYRVLLVDLEIWRRATSLETQKLYYLQFAHFAKGSKHHHYNTKRFHRIRVVKRLTDALKGENFSPQTFKLFLGAFKALLVINFNGENARSLSLFVTYALHDSRASYAKRGLRPKASVARLRKATPTLTPESTPRSNSPAQSGATTPPLSLPDLGIAILNLLAELLCDPQNPHEIVRFAKNVTGKWLLYLLAEPEQRVVVLGAKILARLLVVNGSHYVKKFAEKTGGFVLMKNRLRHWWNTPGIWTICFAILFGRDVASIDFERDFDVFNLVDIFIAHSPQSQLRIWYPEVFPVITAMLETGLRAIVRDRDLTRTDDGPPKQENGEGAVTRGRRRTMSLNAKQPTIDTRAPQTDRLNNFAVVLNSAIQFLSELHSRLEGFRDYTNSSNYVQELLFVLYPVIVTSDSVSAETELLSRGSALTFEGQDVVIRPLSRANGHETPVVRTTNVDASPLPLSRRVLPFRRASSFVLVSADKKKAAQQTSLNPLLSPRFTAPLALKIGISVVEATLEVVLDVFKDQIFTRKEFPGLGLFLKTPPGFQEHQAYFESYILRQTLSSVKNALQFDQQLLHEPRVLTNLARFVTHVSEAVFEGWFLEGAEPLLDFSGFLLEYLERPDIATIKSVRLCTQAIQSIRNTFLRVALLRLADSDESDGGVATTAVIEKMMYWQPIILSSVNNETFSLKMICYLLYTQLSSEHTAVRLAAANFWRLLMVQKPHETSMILADAIHGDTKDLYDGFQKLVELDNETFLEWLDKNKTEMDKFFYGSMTKSWEEFAHSQNKKTEETSQRRVAKRREKLKQWQSDELAADNVWNHHENSTNHWRSNIHASERIKHQRVLQDQQDNATYMTTVLAKLDHQLKGPCGLFEESPPAKWRLDETEGRDRKRLRIIVDNTSREQSYQPKRKDTDPRERPRLDTTVPAISAKEAVGVTPVKGRSVRSSSAVSGASGDPAEEPESASDDDFEMVEAMYEDEDGFEDKNRKVMRSLNRGDQVQYVCNISRVVGLEAIEGLLIVGKDCLYLLDDFFQRSDGEIVRVWQAPPDERDPYVQVIAGKEAVTTRRPPPRSQEDAVRNWKWTEVISISKRRFLHRDVGIEIFFDDGRSYLLTAVSAQARNDIHSRVLKRASHVANPEKFADSEISWRLDSLRNPEEAPQTFGSRFASAFGSASAHPATKKWLKGEMSNFHYLMFVNTLAGRTFNDLTQYPVFPWVLSNYHSEELDLSDPSNFRDLRKPIGIQDPKQEHLIRERFSSFAEMGDASHAFHYGTHYSSAMTVASYLMRLQPFSAAFFLIQGGTWDHADRMFYSIHNVWESVSAKNMADVRELTPEFYFLPDFLTNVNGYNFGLRSDGSTIDNVKLPPWAKGDPAIFIAKQREALESPHVSQNLHHWIDLIFGYKQRGEAAIEAANVFHYMTYQGAIDLDTIVDEKERAQKISVINNFGQTPPQVFQRPHPQRENITKPTKLDTSAESLHRVPGTLLESNDRISSLNYISKSDKLLCSAPFRHNIPPHHDRYMEWGFTDGSVRFYDSHSKKLIGLFEHLHSGQLTTSLFVDGSTLITAGTDCTLAIWTMNKGERGHIDLQNATTLFGHKSSVITLAASRAFSAFLSASLDGRVFLWDLNRNEFVRELDLGARQKRHPVPVQAARINSVTGHIVLACGSRLIVTTLNGAVLLEEEICDTEDDANEGITAVAVYEGTGNEWCERELVFTGHRRGVVKIFALEPTPPNTTTMTTATAATTSQSKWSLNLVNVLNHADPMVTTTTPASVTCILPMARSVYTGDEDGRVYEWDCVNRHH